jgi:toxin secretion/phage lysis holin
MHLLDRLTEAWYIKLPMSIIMLLFTPFQTNLIILFLMITMDTITGSIYAMTTRKFNSKGLKRGLIKLTTYFASILVVRLLELGISSLFSTTSITLFMISYLLFTEAISVLENLTLLGVPIPSGFKNFIKKQLGDFQIFNQEDSQDIKQKYIKEIFDLIDQSKNVLCDEFIESVKILLEELAQFINIVDLKIHNNEAQTDNELFFYRVITLINSTNERVRQRLEESNINRSFNYYYKKHYTERMDKFLEYTKDICTGENTIERKKLQLFDKVLTLAYQIIMDLQKLEICNRRNN